MINHHALHNFVSDWKGRGYEKGETQPFWIALLEALGVNKPTQYIHFEDKVHLDHTSFIDGYIPAQHILIEQKSIEKDLGTPIRQSDGSLLNPFQQAKRYAAELPYSARPRWIITCNFREFWIYDMEQPNGEPTKVLLKNLEKDYYLLNFLTHTSDTQLQREMELSMKAGELVGRIYDKLILQYHTPNNAESLRSLNQLCVRLVFLLFAEDAEILGGRNEFHDYMERFPASQWRNALINLFHVLDTPIEERDPYMEPELSSFPYVNGGLFNDENIEIPLFTEELKQLILTKASSDFDWSEISPTIFGGVFESTLNPETRRSEGMHYTSIQNIHKVIDPLFLDQLNAEYETCKTKKQLLAFQDKLSSLAFFDPACGSGNFLTETYISLRRLENKVIAQLQAGQTVLGDFANPVRVNIHQFYGIEINDFAVSVATTALWIAELQMLRETRKIVHFIDNPLPLKTYHNIHEGNALQIEWKEVCPSPTYIIGNPPFIGARMKSKPQAEDMLALFGKEWKNIGNLDYVGGWYYKAAQMMNENRNIHTALVSTNSITQGEQVEILWKPLFEQCGIQIDFAYRTFRWDSESNQKAHVHCVIIGFSSVGNSDYQTNAGEPTALRQSADKCIYLENNQCIRVHNINGYLVDGPSVFIESRTKPLCDVPEIGIGNKPIDGGNYLFLPEEKDAFIQKEPKSVQYFRPWYGSNEFINNRPRFCLWLGDCSPAELRSMPECLKRVENVRNFRLESKSEGTRKIADQPTRFHVENMPTSQYIIIPETSSERRRYVPMGFMSPNFLCSNAVRLIPGATLFHFGVLTSNVHMAWMRVVCGRLKSDYRYSKDIVYNNFPWCEPTDAQRQKIEQTAQAILDARALYPDCSLADLYDEVTMPVELRRAHQQNDRAVMAAYGFSTTMTESECIAELFKMYQELTTR